MTKDQIQALKSRFGENLREAVPFAELTTVKIGGPAKAFLEIHSKEELEEAIMLAKAHQIPFFVLGGGSNLLVSDEGLDKLVIKIANTDIKKTGQGLEVGAGTSLQDLVEMTIQQGMGGLHKMIGIPGTVGGAIFGNAGAYGQMTGDCIVKVEVFDPESGKFLVLSRAQCEFGYRESAFKKLTYIIFTAWFELPKQDPKILAEESEKCLRLRKEKYKPGTLCPGSFFRNLLTSKVPNSTLSLLPPREDTYGKLPAYIFIEELELKGKQLGEVKIADEHGNLFVNLGKGQAKDFWALAHECFVKVKEKYGVELEPEVQLVNLPPLSSGVFVQNS